MGIEALYRRPDTSKRHPGYTIHPYVLWHLTIDCANQVWVLDATYLPMARGFVDLTAVIDWASRKVLAHRVAITLQACFDTARRVSSVPIEEASSRRPSLPT